MEARGVSGDRSRVSFGLPVRNGENAIGRCLDSLLNQDLEDLEVVVSDNESTDRTPEILREYADRDARVRPLFNERNIGQIENFNGVFRESRGAYFRWIGAEDWLEPQYASRCAQALDEDPGAIAVSTFFRIHVEGGEARYKEYQGELLESERPERRFARMLWTFHAGDALYDPVYCLIRREALEQTALIRMMTKADHMLAAELSLLGRYRHIPECLAHRSKPKWIDAHALTTLRRYRPAGAHELHASPIRLFRELVSIAQASPLGLQQRLRCHWASLVFLLEEIRIRSPKELRRFRRERLGITREAIPFLRRSRGSGSSEPRV
jgi:glycosyltransferase involved in cell wall biosynthesis